VQHKQHWRDHEHASTPDDGRMMRVLSLLLWPLKLLLVAGLLIHDGLSWLLKPVLRWIFALQLMALMMRGVAALPPYGILAALLMPLIIAEPMKLIGFYWLATGRVIAAMLMLGFAYGLSLVLVERVLAAGKAKLMTIGWFAVIYGWLSRLHDAVISWIKATSAWRWCAVWVLYLRIFAARLLRQMRALMQGWFKPKT
jgi:hypothetical protein